MNRAITSALLAVTLTLGCGGAAVAQSPFDAAYTAYELKDYATAVPIFRKLAAQGDAGAQFILGTMYRKGDGVLQDYKEAVRLYRLAAAQGHANAQIGLGVMYSAGTGVLQDYVRAHMWYNLAAAQGNKDAVKNRDRTASRMTQAQIAEAQKLAREWKPVKPKSQ